MKITIEVSNDLLAALEVMARKHGVTLNHEAQDCMDFGISNRFYRMNYNVEKNQEKKVLKSRNQELEAEIARLRAEKK